MSYKPPVGATISSVSYLFSKSENHLDPLDLYTRIARSNGGRPARLKGPLGYEEWVLSDPADIEYVLQTNQHNYQKGKEYKVLGMVAPEGLISAEGEAWLHHRRLMQPAFKENPVRGMAQIMISQTEGMLEQWGDSINHDSLNITNAIRNLTLRIIAQALFSKDIDDTITEKIREAFGYLNWYLDDRMSPRIHAPPNAPTQNNKRFKAAVRDLDQIVLSIIDDRRQLEATDTNRDDLLGMLMALQHEETQQRLTNSQLRDQILTLLVAGHDTSANALIWAFYLLDQNPGVDHALYEEMQQVLGGRSPVAEDYDHLAYTKMVVDEVLRLYPPAWAISRRPLTPDLIGGFEVSAGTPLLISPYVVHRDPSIWTDPEVFDPLRFSPDRSATRPKFAHFPFGGGARQCLGSGFARMELVLVLATILQRYRLTLYSNSDASTEALLTLRPKNYMQMNAVSRQ